MKFSDKEKELIKEQLFILDRLERAFNASITRIKQLDLEKIETFDEWEPVDAFLDKFERLIDFSFQRIFRTIYKIENRTDPVSLIQLTHFIVKMWFAEDEDFLIYIKDLRNRIAHEYIWIWIYHTQEFIEEIIKAFNKFKLTLDAIKTYFRKLIRD